MIYDVSPTPVIYFIPILLIVLLVAVMAVLIIVIVRLVRENKKNDKIASHLKDEEQKNKTE